MGGEGSTGERLAALQRLHQTQCVVRGWVGGVRACMKKPVKRGYHTPETCVRPHARLAFLNTHAHTRTTTPPKRTHHHHHQHPSTTPQCALTVMLRVEDSSLLAQCLIWAAISL